jgi:hypothetical protein
VGTEVLATYEQRRQAVRRAAAFRGHL